MLKSKHMTTILEIRKATDLEIPEIVRINNIVQKTHAKKHPQIFKFPTQSSEIENFFRQKNKIENNLLLVATFDDKVVGYLWATIDHLSENPFKKSQQIMYIHQIAVDTKFQKLGVGHKLIQHIEKLAKDLNLQRLELDSWIFNEKAHGFFKKCGFESYRIIMFKKNF